MSLFCFVLLVFPLSGAFPSEPKCSKYDYEEKTLERTIRMEYAVERMLEENKAVERRIADSLNTLQNEQKQMQSSLEAITEKQSMVDASLRTLADDIRKNQSVLMEKLEKKVDKYSNKGKTITPLVYFTSRDVKDTSPSTGDVIVYQTIMSSSDVSGYDVTTGIFTAPVAGVYMFTVNTCVNAYYATIALTINGDGILKTTHRDDKYNSCYTAQSIVPLMPGDHVCVKCAGGCKLVTDTYRWNTFSGILLHSESGDGR